VIEQLEGRVAVVTGAASGIGLAMVEAFLGEGMSVVLSDLDGSGLDAQVARLSADGGDVFGVVCDVADPDAVVRMAEQCWERHGDVHVLCNNAGVGPTGPMLATTPAEWRWTIGVNVLGVAHGVTTFAPRMVEAGVGHIVNVSSQAGVMTSELLGMYCASKHAVVGLSEALYRELESTPVGVSCLCPEFVRTQVFDVARVRPDWVEVEDGHDAMIPGLSAVLEERGIEPADVAARVVDAVRTDRFWVFTHPFTVGFAERRIEDLRADRNPEPLR